MKHITYTVLFSWGPPRRVRCARATGGTRAGESRPGTPSRAGVPPLRRAARSARTSFSITYVWYWMTWMERYHPTAASTASPAIVPSDAMIRSSTDGFVPFAALLSSAARSPALVAGVSICIAPGRASVAP